MIRTREACLIVALVAAMGCLWSNPARAEVKGPCADCHVMHNSQDGGEVVALEAETPLLKYDCLGCHSSPGSETVVEFSAGCYAPIVLNHAYPGNPLAGGNFYWVEHVGDEYGHNVVNPDHTLNYAPGSPTCGFGGCHAGLASIRYGAGPGPLFNPIRSRGCIGCHDTRGAHHRKGLEYPNGYRLVGKPGDGTKGYRFLSQAGSVYWNIPPHTPPNVEGLEAPWSALQNPGPNAHNEYQDALKPGAYGAYMGRPQGISDFCSGCHQTFHSWQTKNYPNGGKDGAPWLRHPVSTALPSTGEYTTYTTYNPDIPVARPYTLIEGLGGPSATVTPGQDQVMCLSCHYAHGGPYPDALRWDYTQNVARSGFTGGCCLCHRQKSS